MRDPHCASLHAGYGNKIEGMPTSPKRGGFDWEVYFVYLDGDDDSLTVSNCWTVEEAAADARTSLNAYAKSEDEKDQFEIVAVIRADAKI